MITPIIAVTHIIQCRTNAALGRDCMTAGGENFGDAGGFKPCALIPKVARKPAPPAPTTMTSYW